VERILKKSCVRDEKQWVVFKQA